MTIKSKILALGIILFGLLQCLNAAPNDNAKKAQTKPQKATAQRGAQAQNARQANQKAQDKNARTQASQSQRGNPSSPTQANQRGAMNPQASQSTQNPNQANRPKHLPPTPDNNDRSSWGVKSGFFGGVGIGAGMMLFSTPNMNNNKHGSTSSYNGTLCGSGNQCRSSDSVLTVDYTAKVGYQHYFTLHQGLRAYVSYTGGSGFPVGYSGASLYYMNNSADFNLDYLLEIAQVKRMAFGLVGGVSVGYANFLSTQTGDFQVGSSSTSISSGTKSKGGLMVGLNVGVGYTFLRHHRFDITAKIPLLYIGNVAGIYKGNMWVTNGAGGATETINYRYASMNVSYSFIF